MGFLLVGLHFMKDLYPLNYALLGLTTLLVGVFWGLNPIDFGAWLHFQVIGILMIAMIVSTVLAAVLTTEKVRPWQGLLVSHLAGWSVGATIDVVIVLHFGLSSLAWAMTAVVATLVLLVGVLLLDSGQLLVRGNPDDFLTVIITMDSALLVVSMPIFVLSCCLLHASPAEAPDVEAAVAGEGVGDGASPS